MTEQLETLRLLAERPSSPPEPVSELWRRADDRRTKRARRRAVVTAMVALAVVAVAVFVLKSGSGTVTVSAGPPRPPRTVPATAAGGVPLGTRLQYSVPAGWQTLFAQGDELVVGTQPLSSNDLALALLARDDTVFDSFPAAGVVVVVGDDRLQGKYTTGTNGATTGPGPVDDLGPPKTLAAGISVRRGDLPSSIWTIASYSGPAAPPSQLQQAVQMAQGIELVATGDPSVRPPAPPAGSSMGFPNGPLPIPDKNLPVVARASFAGTSLTLAARSDCAYLGFADATQPTAGGCANRPAGPTVTEVGEAVILLGPPPAPPGVNGTTPNSATSTAVIFRAGPGVRTLTARFAAGGSVPAVIGTDGWGFAVGSGRIYSLTGTGTDGQSIEPLIVN